MCARRPKSGNTGEEEARCEVMDAIHALLLDHGGTGMHTGPRIASLAVALLVNRMKIVMVGTPQCVANCARGRQ